jgi:drug/metabolite transporter (DMT)-like permease
VSRAASGSGGSGRGTACRRPARGPAPALPAAPGAGGSGGAAPLDLALLAVAVTSVSLSAPLVASTAAPALAIAFWRNAMAVGVIGPFALVRHRREIAACGRRALLLSAVAGVLLAAHFACWLPSLRMTSVASSTALVTTTPVWTTLLLRLRGHRVPLLVWSGIGVAFVGVLFLTGLDLSLSTRALAGDALALGGGVAGAGYVLVGAEVRRTLSTVAYTLVCYTTTAVLLAVACLSARQALTGYSGKTWLKLALLTACAQLLGHSLINRVVRGLGPTVTSTALLLETPGAALVAAVWLGQLPSAYAYPALAVILLGLGLVITSDRRRPAEPEVPATGAV